MILLTTKLPKEVTVALQLKEARKHHFTVGSALANVGTVKSVDARSASMLYVATAACVCAVTAETVTSCVVATGRATLVDAT